MTLVAELERARRRRCASSRSRRQLRTYECDGLTGHRAVPQAVVLPRTTAEVQAAVRVCARARHPVRRPRRGHRPLRRCRPGRRGHRDRPRADEPDPRGRRAQPAGARPAGRHQPRRQHARSRPTASTTRPTRPASRCARSAATSPRTPAARTASSTASPPTTCSSSRSCWPTASVRPASTGTGALDLLGAFVGSEGTLGIATEIVVAAAAPARSGSRRCWPRSTSTDAAGEVVSAIIAAGIVPGRDRDDGRAHDRGGRGGGRRRATARRRRGAARRARRPGRARSRLLAARCEALCREAGATEVRVAADRGRAGGVLARPQGGVRRDGPDQPRLLRPGRRGAAHARCPRRCAGSASCRATHGLARRQRVPRRRRQPAPAGALRRRGRRARPSGPSSSPPRSWRPASTPAARSPASTASGVDKACYMPRMFSRRRPGDHAAAARARSTRTASATRARCSRRRGCAARCPARTGAHPLEREGVERL